MALKAILTTLDGLDENTKKLYVEKNGKFVLDVEAADGWNLEDVTALKKALSKERDGHKTAIDQLKVFEGLDAEEARKAIEQLKELDGKPLDKAVEERIKVREGQLVGKHETERKKLSDRASKLQQQLEHELTVSAATRALASKGANTELLLPHIQRHLKVVEQGDRWLSQVVDPLSGNARISNKAGSTEPMTLDELVAEFEQNPTYASGFPGSGNSGSGKTKGKDSGGSGSKTIRRSDTVAVGKNLEKIATGEIQVVDD